MKLRELLDLQIQHSASDLILKVGSAPLLRIHGDLVPLNLPPLTDVDIESGVVEILNKEQISEFHKEMELDFSYEIPGIARYRVNLFRQKGHTGMVFRLIPASIPTIDDLKFPPIIKEMAMRPRGLIIVTGPSGCGKSTTQAAIINHRNSNDTCHIVTVEDPIEFVHKNKKALITQREVGRDTLSFANALKFVLRQDPDVILVGEMRDLETISLSITAAETGHLVITTLHTTDSISTIDRIIDVFPAHQQNQIRMQLSLNLVGVISQTLVKRLDKKGRIAAYEILVATSPVRNLIREAKTHQLASILQTSQKQGMITLDTCLAQYVRSKIVSYEEALSKCLNAENFKREVGAL
ncbi:MAG: type IV pilus twitching motility protein PilT, partial [candidate division WOR-3 bacterium]